MFSIEADDDVVMCPYNNTHRMLRKRLQPHLIKCRQNYPQLELQKCPFNNTHHIPEPEFSLHVENCPDRKLITQYKYDTVQPKEEEPVRHTPVECEENWDDTEADDYDPQKFIAEKNVLRKPMGIPPAERKEFIKTERKRLGDEESYSDSDDDNKEDIQEESSITDFNKKEDEESVSVKRIRSISPSPPPQKKRSRSRSPISSTSYKQIDVHNSYLQPSPPPPRIAGGFSENRHWTYDNRERESSPAAYDIDGDPYYNSGINSSNRNDSYSSTNITHIPRIVAYPTRRPAYGRGVYRGNSYYNNGINPSDRNDNYSSNNDSNNPRLVAYPTRRPSYGRGAYRGYNYNRRNSSRFSNVR